MVPMKLFKAVFDFQNHEIWAFVINNSPDAKADRISIHELEIFTGIRVFHQVNRAVQSP